MVLDQFWISGLGSYGLGFRVSGLGFNRVEGLGFRELSRPLIWVTGARCGFRPAVHSDPIRAPLLKL